MAVIGYSSDSVDLKISCSLYSPIYQGQLNSFEPSIRKVQQDLSFLKVNLIWKSKMKIPDNCKDIFVEYLTFV